MIKNPFDVPFISAYMASFIYHPKYKDGYFNNRLLGEVVIDSLELRNELKGLTTDFAKALRKLKRYKMHESQEPHIRSLASKFTYQLHCNGYPESNIAIYIDGNDNYYLDCQDGAFVDLYKSRILQAQFWRIRSGVEKASGIQWASSVWSNDVFDRMHESLVIIQNRR